MRARSQPFHEMHVASDVTETVGETVVVVLPDTGERYLSTDLFA